MVAQAKQDLRGLVSKLGDWLKETFSLRLALEMHKQPYPGMAVDLALLLPADFLRRMPFTRVQHLPRYLRGMQARAERWKRDQAKDTLRAAELAPFLAAVRRLAAGGGFVREGGKPAVVAKTTVEKKISATAEQVETFRWLVEEFRVSLFAQELGTAEPVSVVRLQRALEEMGEVVKKESLTSATAVAPASTRKGPPLKSLGALDQLFRK